MCGIAGVFNIKNSERMVADLLFSIQHRGQESCGISTRTDNGNILTYKNMGLVKNVLTPEILKNYSGDISIGHVRYPTAGSSNALNSQPHSIEMAHGAHMAICSNGDIINYAEIRTWLETEHGFLFKSDNDGELIGRLIAYYYAIEKMNIEDAIFKTQNRLKGAFSTLLIFKGTLYAIRDPHGFRPFVMGNLTWSGEGEIPSNGTAFASESCAFGIIGAKFIRELEPGEIIKLEKDKPVKILKVNNLKKQHCVFELIYFSRPDSIAYGELVYLIRKNIGRSLAARDADIPVGDDLAVIAVPDSSNFVALGYAQAKGLSFDMGLIRNHYVGRTFTKPNQEMRDEGVKQKFNPLPGFFKDKRVILVDDSIVRGTTLRKIVRMIKSSGAKEVHVRIGSPKVIGPCFYGIDTPTKEELIANNMTEDGIREFLNAESLKYMNIGDFEKILTEYHNFCFACFDRNYIYSPEDYHKVNSPK